MLSMTNSCPRDDRIHQTLLMVAFLYCTGSTISILTSVSHLESIEESLMTMVLSATLVLVISNAGTRINCKGANITIICSICFSASFICVVVSNLWHRISAFYTAAVLQLIAVMFTSAISALSMNPYEQYDGGFGQPSLSSSYISCVLYAVGSGTAITMSCQCQKPISLYFLDINAAISVSVFFWMAAAGLLLTVIYRHKKVDRKHCRYFRKANRAGRYVEDGTYFDQRDKLIIIPILSMSNNFEANALSCYMTYAGIIWMAIVSFHSLGASEGISHACNLVPILCILMAIGCLYVGPMFKSFSTHRKAIIVLREFILGSVGLAIFMMLQNSLSVPPLTVSLVWMLLGAIIDMARTNISPSNGITSGIEVQQSGVLTQLFSMAIVLDIVMYSMLQPSDLDEVDGSYQWVGKLNGVTNGTKGAVLLAGLSFLLMSCSKSVTI